MRRVAVVWFLGLASVGPLAGCSDPPATVDPSTVPSTVEIKDIPVDVNRDVDLLFVIDDTMAEPQANLAANFPKFLDVLSTTQGGLPNLHLAVVTSDMGTKGADDPAPAPSIGTIGSGGCSGLGKAGNLQLFGAPVTGGQYLSDIRLEPSGLRQVNYTGTLGDAFAKMAKAGAGGCGFEQHLEAMKQALQPTNTVNQGFLRPDALLAVVFLADQDDCSMARAAMLAPEDATLGPLLSFRCTRFGVLCDDGGATISAMNQPGAKTRCHPDDASPYLTKVGDYVRFLKGLKVDPKDVIVAGILGTPAPFEVELRTTPTRTTPILTLAHSCMYGGASGVAVANPAIRLKFFLDQFPNRSTFTSICQQDLSGGLQQLGDLVKTVIGDPCIEGKLADVDPQTAGTQADCAVSSVTDPGTTFQRETVMPRCSPEDATATNQPCWHLVSDPVACPCSVPEQAGVCATNAEHYVLKIEGKETLTKDTHVLASCSLEPAR